MWIQSSFKGKDQKGQLYVVPTPIGNLEDITVRAINVLKSVDYIAAEDTRNTKKLCNHFEISTPLFSYHEHNKSGSGNKILDYLREGKSIAIVSDAGTPCVSDPGYEIIRDATQLEMPVIALPGASAGITALSASGLPTEHFYFYGFLNRTKKNKKEELEKLKIIQDTVILYEAPHRLKETLRLILEVLGSRKIVLARELTKLYEEYFRGTISEAIHFLEEHDARGEYVLIVEGNSETCIEKNEWWDEMTIEDHVEHYMKNQARTSKEAIKLVSKDRNLQKREIYQIFHTGKDE